MPTKKCIDMDNNYVRGTEPVSPTLLSGYASFHSTMRFAVRKDAFHETYIAYAQRAMSYLAYGSYPHGATHLCRT